MFHHPGLRGAKAGLWASIVMGGLMLGLFLLKLLAGSGGQAFLPLFVVSAPIPPDMLFNWVGWILGIPFIFNLVHSLPFGLDLYAKYLLFTLVFLSYLSLWWVLGLFWQAAAAKFGRFVSGLMYTGGSILLTGLVLLPLQPGVGLFGLSPNNFLFPPLPSLLWAAVFGAVFALVLHWRQARTVRQDVSRRHLVKGLFLGLSGVAVFSALGEAFFGAKAYAQSALETLLARIRGLSPEVTPTSDHYVISKNIISPSVAERGWSLKIGGLVEEELEFSLDDLKALPQVERPSTLMCISNPVGGDLIGNSVWTGVRLRDLLRRAGVQPSANELILRAADNYADSFPLEAALRDGSILAYLQNGRPLTRDHGFPARVLVPGIYGMKNVKWIQTIELAAQDFQGYWQRRGWSDSAVVRTMSRIDTGRATMLADGRAAIGGIAYAGLRGVERVEVSVDEGRSWQAAEVKAALNELSWNLWGFTWDAPPGTYTVLVRATDGTGEIQTGRTARPLPDGAAGYHELKVRVS